MKSTALLILLSFSLFLAVPHVTTAQTKAVVPRPLSMGAIDIGSGAQFLMRGGAVVLHQDNNFQPLTKNIRLANGTKINYKSGIVELPGGKITTLREGDYVTADGDIVFSTPGSAAAARGDNSVAPTAQYEPYVQHGTSAADVAAQLTTMNQKITLMAQKIQLLNQKISVLSGSGKGPDTSQLDQQIQALDEQLRQVK